MNFIYTLLFFFFISIFSSQSLAVKIVRIQIDYGSNVHIIDLELYDDVVGPSVTNFLNYVNDDGVNGRRFDKTFITRSLPGFIVQSGSYTFRPADPITEILAPVGSNTALQAVPRDATILNDFNLSNIRGTISFAKIPNDPDSANSGWFINLADNSENLDNQNEGFTVFGQVIDDGMTTVDEMASFPIQGFAAGALGADFENLPVVDYDFSALIPPGIFQSNLIMLTSFNEINRPIIRLSPSSIDYELDIAGDNIEKVVTINLKNTGNEELDIAAINNLITPYNIKTDGCSSTTLQPQNIDVNSSCDIEISFSATALGVFDSFLVIPYTSTVDSDIYSVSFSITGEGVPPTAVSTVSVANITYDELAINSVVDETIVVKNKGGSTLTVAAINLIGVDSNQFTIDNADCNTNTTLNINETCILTISFIPSTVGNKSATLEILTNTNTSNITLSGIATKPILSIQSTVSLVGNVNQAVSTIFAATNTGDGDIIFTDVTISGVDAASFTQQNRCPGTNNSSVPTQELGAGASCDIFVEYIATDLLPKTAILTIASNDPERPLFTINLNGNTGNSIISVPATLNVGASEINGTASSKALVITNTGLAPLEITALSGLDNSDFSQVNTCVGAQLMSNDTCSIFITLTTAVGGVHIATLTIHSNDIANPSVNVVIEGFGDTDSDGVLGSIEQASPNSGDNNNDGIADAEQSNVATLTALNLNYITFISDNSLILGAETAFVDVKLIDIKPTDEPEAVNFDYGLFSYSITLPVGDGVKMAILLPPNEQPSAYYKYGSTVDTATLHWYNFSYDETTNTGAKFFGTVSIKDPITGTDIQRSLVIISYIDGQRGDDDLSVNGSILSRTSGISIIRATSASGYFSYSEIIFIILMFLWRKKHAVKLQI